MNEEDNIEIFIGLKNIKRWTTLKTAFSCETNEIFITKLLNIAQEYLNRRGCNETEDNKSADHDDKGPTIRNKRKKNDAKHDNNVKQINKINEKSTIIDTNKELRKTNVVDKSSEISTIRHEDKSKRRKLEKNTSTKKEKSPKKRPDSDHDIRKAPQLNVQSENNLEQQKFNEKIATININNNNNDRNNNNNNKAAIRIKLCQHCNKRHTQNQCPLDYPVIIKDSLTLEEWEEKYKVDDPKDDSTYAYMSLPNCLQLLPTNSPTHGLGVWTLIDIKESTQFGPLIGKQIKEVDISEDSNMRDIWEIQLDNNRNNIYVNTEDLLCSNWLRFIRPSPNRDDRNITIIRIDNDLYFTTIKSIKTGEELLYWQDCIVTNNKKKMEKTSCGGCNMTFSHPLYYRTHCSVFHDIRYSLTIRKYHCKVCGAAVLGKENIMKHAAELHNGQGAYQCQFCKKFFLRLNYLEMHRTYGCSANPHRSRPLCDFCGRKFCQPQKLKVHIKRMHSDLADVLEEFQCKICLKILGSRAALQRHLKEVHQKQMDTACSCSRCGKHFQNKSNLKIHMLTHSGIKPFKCTVSNCNAAFTTKQCLQFHYKKVHNFDENVMPKIERSVDYTFEAYSGADEAIDKRDENSNNQHDSNTNTLDDDSEIDENSMDSRNVDDFPAVQSPLEINENSPEPTYNMAAQTSSTNVTMKISSKGSKKWIGDQPELYQIEQRTVKEELSMQLQETNQNVQDSTTSPPTPPPSSQQSPPTYERTKLNEFNRHETSNASLLVEAALDSVCNEPNIDIDVNSTTNCTDALVNNLYTLAPTDTLPDVTYNESVCINETRDINLISPSVNDHISVTDELNDELRNNQNINMDYSSFQQDEFSPGNSPEIQHRTNFVRNYINNLSPTNQQNYNQIKSATSPVPPPVVPSPPRYDFGHAVNTEHLSSDDSNGMAAQNLSLHSKHDLQLDLSIYNKPTSFQIRRTKFDDVLEKSKNYTNNTINENDDNGLEHEQVELAHSIGNDKDKINESDWNKYPDDLSTDIRNKFDLDMRIKNYKVDSETIQTSRLYETTNDIDFRNKSLDLIETKPSYETSNNIETDFRTDRNFEPLVLNSSELQGLDMSARSFHNYTNINRYHHLYPDVDRVDLRLNYSPPVPSYTHADILRVSLDLTSPGRHSVDLSLRTHQLHQIANSRLLTDHPIQTNPHRLLDQSRLLSSDLSTARHLTSLTETSSRILSDHTTNRILSNNDQLTTNHLLSTDQRLLTTEDSRIITEQPRLLEQTRLIGDGRILPPPGTPTGTVSPVPAFTGYSVSQSPYHPAALAPRSHISSSPTPTPYHHYSTYY